MIAWLLEHEKRIHKMGRLAQQNSSIPLFNAWKALPAGVRRLTAFEEKRLYPLLEAEFLANGTFTPEQAGKVFDLVGELKGALSPITPTPADIYPWDRGQPIQQADIFSQSTPPPLPTVIKAAYNGTPAQFAAALDYANRQFRRSAQQRQEDQYYQYQVWEPSGEVPVEASKVEAIYFLIDDSVRELNRKIRGMITAYLTPDGRRSDLLIEYEELAYGLLAKAGWEGLEVFLEKRENTNQKEMPDIPGGSTIVEKGGLYAEITGIHMELQEFEAFLQDWLAGIPKGIEGDGSELETREESHSPADDDLDPESLNLVSKQLNEREWRIDWDLGIVNVPLGYVSALTAGKKLSLRFYRLYTQIEPNEDVTTQVDYSDGSSVVYEPDGSTWLSVRDYASDPFYASIMYRKILDGLQKIGALDGEALIEVQDKPGKLASDVKDSEEKSISKNNKIYVPKDIETKKIWQNAYKVVIKTRERFREEWDNGTTDNPDPTIKDFRDAIAREVKSYEERHVRRIIKAGDAGILN